jgi:hypothetical protein
MSEFTPQDVASNITTGVSGFGYWIGQTLFSGFRIIGILFILWILFLIIATPLMTSAIEANKAIVEQKGVIKGDEYDNKSHAIINEYGNRQVIPPDGCAH